MVPVERSAAIEGGKQKAIAGYRAFLNTAPDHELRPEAMRRLGDLQMESADEQQLAGADTPAPEPGIKSVAPDGALSAADYRNAIKWYQDLLRAYPN